MGWPADERSAAVLTALVEVARVRAPGMGLDAPLNRPSGGELTVQRTVRVSKGSATASAIRSLPRGRNRAVDTLTCVVGDSLVVTLSVHALTEVGDAVVEDPLPAGCGEGIAEMPQGGPRKVRNGRMVFGNRRLARGENQVIHVLHADRAGFYHVPPARVYLARIPELEARTRPLVVRICK